MDNLGALKDLTPEQVIALSPLQQELRVHRDQIASSHNRVLLDGDRVLVGLTRGLIAVCSARHYVDVASRKWCVLSTTGPKRYAYNSVRGRENPKENVTILLHRFVLGVTSRSVHVDHINGDTMDNRDENLRTCTHAQNLWNAGVSKNSKTGVKGVTVRKKDGKFEAKITANRRIIRLGAFEKIEDAAMAYAEAAKKYHGEFANHG